MGKKLLSSLIQIRKIKHELRNACLMYFNLIKHSFQLIVNDSILNKKFRKNYEKMIQVIEIWCVLILRVLLKLQDCYFEKGQTATTIFHQIICKIVLQMRLKKQRKAH